MTKTILTPGFYPARATGAYSGQNKAGEPQIVIALELTDPLGDTHTLKYTNKLNANSAPYAKQALLHAGWEGVSLDTIGDDIADAKVDLVANVETKEYDGRVFSAVKYIFVAKPREDRAPEPLSPVALKAADKMLRQAAVPVRANKEQF